jgi:hypothetical protein
VAEVAEVAALRQGARWVAAQPSVQTEELAAEEEPQRRPVAVSAPGEAVEEERGLPAAGQEEPSAVRPAASVHPLPASPASR